MTRERAIQIIKDYENLAVNLAHYKGMFGNPFIGANEKIWLAPFGYGNEDVEIPDEYLEEKC